MLRSISLVSQKDMYPIHGTLYSTAHNMLPISRDMALLSMIGILRGLFRDSQGPLLRTCGEQPKIPNQ